MSAARQFSLEPTGPEPLCDFRGCILNAWHDGDHQFAKKEIQWNYDRHCVVCGISFTVLGADSSMVFHTCGSEACLLHYARRASSEAFPLMCRCAQRPYAHDIAIHQQLRQESYDSRLKYRWPWSLCLSRREEPSTERNAG